MTHSNIFDTEKLKLQTLLVKNHSGFSGNFLGCYIMIIANRLIDIGHREYITRKHSGLKGLVIYCILQRINHWRCNVPMSPHICLSVWHIFLNRHGSYLYYHAHAGASAGSVISLTALSGWLVGLLVCLS